MRYNVTTIRSSNNVRQTHFPPTNFQCTSNPHSTPHCPAHPMFLPTYTRFVAYHVLTEVAARPQVDTGFTLTMKCYKRWTAIYADLHACAVKVHNRD